MRARRPQLNLRIRRLTPILAPKRKLHPTLTIPTFRGTQVLPVRGRETRRSRLSSAGTSLTYGWRLSGRLGVIDLFIKSIFCCLQKIIEFGYQGVEFLGVFLDGNLRCELN